jgi:CRISPR-associated protein Cas2
MRVFDLLTGNGDRVQYSVFFCDLDKRERVLIEAELRNIIKHDEDQVLFVDLGKAENDLMARIKVCGVSYNPLHRATIV